MSLLSAIEFKRAGSVVTCVGSLFVVLFSSSIEAQLVTPPLQQAERWGQTFSVRGDFTNQIFTNTPEVEAVVVDSAAFYGGQVCDSDCPTDGAVVLARASFGQALASAIPYPEFVQEAVDDSRKRLYFNEADDIPADADDPDNGVYSQQSAAFRYKRLIYGDDPQNNNEITNLLVARDAAGDPLEKWQDLYSDEERLRLLAVEKRLRDALKYAPRDQALRQTLLDLYYDQAVAEVVSAKELLSAAVIERFIESGENGSLTPKAYQESARVIEDEIVALESVIDGYRFALNGYFELLNNYFGVSVLAIDETMLSERPFGFYLFATEVPTRSLDSATYLDSQDQLRDVKTGGIISTEGQASQLLSGYKDLVLIFDIMADLAEAIEEQVRLYVARGLDNVDREQALLLLIKESHEQLYLQGNILLDIFPDGSLPAKGSPSGFQESVVRWEKALSSLVGAKGYLDGSLNVLGFDKDFLMFVQNSGDKVNSFDAIIDHMLGVNGPLTNALSKHNSVVANYENYRATRDRLQTEFLDRRTIIDDRLFKITGAHRCSLDGSDCSGQCPDPRAGGACYFTPNENAGSEISQQLVSLELANNRIDQNITRMENLYERIEIEIDRRGKEAQVEGAINDVILEYGEKQAKLTEAIAAARARAARARKRQQQRAGFFSYAVGIVAAPFTGGASLVAAAGGAFNAFSASTRGDSSAKEARIQAEKERLSANERVAISELQSQILDNNSRALIKTWWLEASTIAVDISQSELIYDQEVDRLGFLYDEKQDLEARMDQQLEFLADRYFADPSHRLKLQNSVIEADLAFREAQKWVFFASRALEYKWNFPFSIAVDGTVSGDFWDINSVFSVRNAPELQALVSAFQNYEAEERFTIGLTRVTEEFSLRKDFFGYRFFNPNNTQEQNIYPDPITGEPVNAVEAFRSELLASMDSDGVVSLEFNTNRELTNRAFFRGPGAPFGNGTFLDRIVSLKIVLPGAHSLGNNQLLGNLYYGGASFVRNWDRGTVIPGGEDQVAGEFTSYPTRYWFKHPAGEWRFRDGLEQNIPMKLASNPEVPEDTFKIETFKERSVAATNWILKFNTRDLGFDVLRVEELDDIVIYFEHEYATRP